MQSRHRNASSWPRNVRAAAMTPSMPLYGLADTTSMSTPLADHLSRACSAWEGSGTITAMRRPPASARAQEWSRGWGNTSGTLCLSSGNDPVHSTMTARQPSLSASSTLAWTSATTLSPEKVACCPSLMRETRTSSPGSGARSRSMSASVRPSRAPYSTSSRLSASLGMRSQVMSVRGDWPTVMPAIFVCWDMDPPRDERSCAVQKKSPPELPAGLR